MHNLKYLHKARFDSHTKFFCVLNGRSQRSRQSAFIEHTTELLEIDVTQMIKPIKQNIPIYALLVTRNTINQDYHFS